MDTRNNPAEYSAENEAHVLYEKYLDSRYVREKREILKKMWMKEYLTDKMIDDFSVTMDIVIPQADLETRYYDLLRCLDSMARFETTGLR